MRCSLINNNNLHNDMVLIIFFVLKTEVNLFVYYYFCQDIEFYNIFLHY